MKTIYLVKHSGPFVDIKNYVDYEGNMILSVEGEKRAEELWHEAKEIYGILKVIY